MYECISKRSDYISTVVKPQRLLTVSKYVNVLSYVFRECEQAAKIKENTSVSNACVYFIST